MMDKRDSDAEYKRYIASMDKVLGTFDAIQEWQDMITFLTKLQKTLQSYQKYPVIPRKLLVAKRLAQTLNPALPAGVHSKAVEAYTIICKNSMDEQLAQDLPLWSMGLFSFTALASMSVKPLLLDLYSNYYLPLGPKLVPCMKAFILAVLPLLEEEGNEFFDRTASLLDKVSRGSNLPTFYAAFWMAISSSVQCRRAACNFLLKKMPKIKTKEDMVAICGSYSTLLADALCCLVQDANLLVKRGALELLLTQFEFSISFFSNQEKRDIIKAAISVVLARDMSLNRRLFAIIDSCEDDVVFVIKEMFSVQEETDVAILQKPYKIMISLMDRQGYGDVVMNKVLITMLESLYLKSSKSKEIGEAILPISITLISSTHPYLFWKNIHFWIESLESEDSINLPSSEWELRFKIVDFIFDTCNFVDDEVQRVHLPFLYYTLSTLITRTHHKSPQSLQECLALILKLSRTITSPVFENSWNLSEFRGSSQEESVKSAGAESPLSAFAGISIQDISLIYKSQDGADDQGKRRLFEKIIVGRPIMEEAFWNVSAVLCTFERELRGEEGRQVVYAPMWKAVCDIVERHVPFHGQYSWTSSNWCQALRGACFMDNFKVATAAISTLLEIGITVKWNQDVEFCNKAFARLWKFIDPAIVKYHSKIVALLVKLANLYTAIHLEQNMSIELKRSSSELGKFGIIWKYFEQDLVPGFTLDLPLCNVFDSLLDENESKFYIAKSWIYNFVSNGACTRMIHPLLSILGHPDIVFKVTSSNDALQVVVRRLYNQSQVVYAIDVLEKLVSLGSQIGFLEVISETPCPSSFSPSFASATLNELKMIDALILEILMFSLAKSNFKDPLMMELQMRVRIKAIKFLKTIFSSCSKRMISKVSCNIVHRSILLNLQSETIVPIQVELLSSVRAVSLHLFDWSSYATIYPDLASKSSFVVSLLAFNAQSSQIVQEWTGTALHHLAFFSSDFEGSMLILFQQLCQSIMSLIPVTPTEPMQAESNAVILLHATQKTILYCLRNESCSKDMLNCAPIILSTLITVLNATQPKSVHAPEITGVISLILRDLGKQNSKSTIEGIVLTWIWNLNSGYTMWVFEMLFMTQIGELGVVSNIAELLKQRSSKHGKDAPVPITEKELLQFLIAYLSALAKNSELFHHCWLKLSPFIKDSIHSSLIHRPYAKDLLKLLDLLFGIVPIDHRAQWKDCEELYCKVFESVCHQAARLIESGGGRNSKYIPASTDSLASTPISTFCDPKKFGLDFIIPLSGGAPLDETVSKEAMQYLSDETLYDLQTRIDKEKSTILVGHLSTLIISPVLRTRDVSKMQLVGTIMKIATLLLNVHHALKVWKKDLWLVFLDSKFFNLGIVALTSWKDIVHGIVSSESELLLDVIAKTSVTSGPTIFSSKDQEILDRSLMIRRLSFAVFAGPFDFHLIKLPAIQEKIAESLKLGSPIVQAEVLFCIQVLLLRISPKNLSNIWLVITNELIKIFSFHVRNVSSHKWELKTLLEAAKLLYVACHLKVDEFQSFQWIFIQDYPSLIVDAKRPPLTLALEKAILTANPSSLANASMLNFLAMRNITSRDVLLPFFQSSSSYGSLGPTRSDLEETIFSSFHQE